MDQYNPSSQHLRLTPAKAALEIAQRALVEAANARTRILVGIVGGPGSGKSTLAAEVIHILNDRIDGSAARVPMDGFHMLQAKLEREELVAYKGAPQTFEAQHFIDLLRKLKTANKSMSVPGYSRAKEDVVPDAFTIAGNVPILVVEGNYLLLDQSPWSQIPELLALSFYLDVPKEITKKRLLKRHAEHKLFTKDHIAKHVEQVDMVNYDAVAACKDRADVVIEIDVKE